MAETSNNFTGGRMNKDIDDRLLAGNEYRNAVNLQISKSENSDVGSLQTVLGNELLIDFNELETLEDLECIGYFSDITNNRVFLFLTDYDGVEYSPAAHNFIYVYNAGTPVSSINPVKLVEGAFLNFSKLNPIIGVNLLEGLLFWTDNRNQPRKINVDRQLGYYTAEEHISVATFAPYQSIEFWQESELAEGEYETTMKDVATPFLPNGGSCFVPEDITDATILFRVNTVNGFIDVGEQVYIINDGVIEPLLSTTGDTVVVAAFRYYMSALELFGGLSPIEIPAGSTLVFKPNPYFNSDYFGDTDFLQDRFVRFSYRFRFDDGEYSIFAPFSQVAFIPKKDGYFQYFDYPTSVFGDNPDIDDQALTYQSTEVNFMENKVNQILLRIPLPANKNVLQNALKITAIDILYKESDSLATKVLETLTINDIANQTEGGEDYFVYNYEAQKPYKTLPETDLTRVYDKVPVRAFSQEIISNRVVYGNFQDKHTPLPPNVVLNYNVAIDEKRTFSTATNFTSIIEYPNHNVKQNRSYQVGVILSDKFGRQSSVLLSPSDISVEVFGQRFYGSTVYLPYLDENIDTASFPGNSIKVLFNDPIPENPNGTYPGVYNKDPESEDYNPLGWYSYKIVVKQTEQDYYNVYLPGVMAGYPNDPTLELGATSHAVLINDNINKVPRDLKEVGPTQAQFSSSVKLNGRVVNFYRVGEVYKNEQFYPEKGKQMTVSTISPAMNLFYGDVDPASIPPIKPGFNCFYNSVSDPLIARISTPTKYGEVVQATETNFINLAVAETNPTESLLDIYWETSTSGTIEDLNAAILADTGGIVKITTPTYNQFNEEISAGGSEIFDTPLRLYTDSVGFIENDPVGWISNFTMSVTNAESTPLDVTNYFTLIGLSNPTVLLPEWNVKVTSDFYDNIFYMNDAAKRTFIFTFNVVVNGINLTFTRTIGLLNVSPYTSSFPQPSVLYPTTVTEVIYSVGGVNGAINADLQYLDLNWTITSQTRTDDPDTQVNYFTLNQFADNTFPSGLGWYADLINSAPGTIPPTQYTVVMKLSDAGASYTVTYNVDFTVTPDEVKEYTAVDPDTSNVYKFVVLQITDEFSSTWYYSFTGSWASLISSGSVIYIPSTGYSCAIGWPVKANTSTGAIGAAKSCMGISSLTTTSAIIDASAYTFAFN
jgi:hypothetical protein